MNEPVPGPPSADLADFQSGQPVAFGKYQVLARLGSGGMATVFRACLRGPAGAARMVALKVIHPGLSQQPLFVQMFLGETRLAMALSHRNIVQTFDAGQEQDQYYMAMELVEGGSLHELLKRRPGRGLPVDIALFIALELCSALHHAHELRPDLVGQPGAVVHCDVSPSNILLGRDGEVKLADFGVARARDRLSQTSLDLVKGKLSYMAPEQARGRPETRTDLFAVGLVLHEMLAGRTMRRLTDLQEVIEGPRRIPSLRDQRPEIPARLEELIRSCLCPDPAGRPGTAQILREELASLLFEAQVRSNSGSDAHARLSTYLLEVLAEPLPAPHPLAQALARQAAVLSSVTEPPLDTTQPPLPVGRQRPGRPTAPTTVEPRPSSAAPAREPRPTAPTTVETGARGQPLSVVAPNDEAEPLLPARSRLGPGLLIGGLLVALVGSGWLFLGRSDRPSAGAGALSSDQRVQLSGRPDAQMLATPGRRDAAAAPATPRTATPRTVPDQPPRARAGGQLQLNSFPWAKVYVNGRYVGDTPVQGLRLPAGVHRVRLHNPERDLTKTLQIRIEPQRTVSRVIKLTR